MSDVMIARTSAVVVLDGTPHRVRRGRTYAHADSQAVREHPELWRPLAIDFPTAGAPDADDLDRYREHSQTLNTVAWRIADALGDIPPGATDHDGDIESLVDRLLAKAQDGAAAPGPPAKDVRAWARAEGIDVPARGQLPADVVARYQAAHE